MFNRFGNKVDIRVVFSSLWILILFNVIFRDIHEFLRPGMLEEVINGPPVSEALLLVGGIMMELIILMIPLSRLASYRVARWANIGVGLFALVSIITNNLSPDMDDIFFAAVEVVTLVFIIWSAWTWRETAVETSPRLKPTPVIKETYS